MKNLLKEIDRIKQAYLRELDSMYAPHDRLEFCLKEQIKLLDHLKRFVD